MRVGVLIVFYFHLVGIFDGNFESQFENQNQKNTWRGGQAAGWADFSRGRGSWLFHVVFFWGGECKLRKSVFSSETPHQNFSTNLKNSLSNFLPNWIKYLDSHCGDVSVVQLDYGLTKKTFVEACEHQFNRLRTSLAWVTYEHLGVEVNKNHTEVNLEKEAAEMIKAFENLQENEESATAVCAVADKFIQKIKGESTDGAVPAMTFAVIQSKKTDLYSTIQKLPVGYSPYTSYPKFVIEFMYALVAPDGYKRLDILSKEDSDEKKKDHFDKMRRQAAAGLQWKWQTSIVVKNKNLILR